MSSKAHKTGPVNIAPTNFTSVRHTRQGQRLQWGTNCALVSPVARSHHPPHARLPVHSLPWLSSTPLKASQASRLRTLARSHTPCQESSCLPTRTARFPSLPEPTKSATLRWLHRSKRGGSGLIPTGPFRCACPTTSHALHKRAPSLPLPRPRPTTLAHAPGSIC